MMTYREFYEGTEVPRCGRGKELRAIGDRVRSCEVAPTVPKVISVLTAALAWGWKKGAKHGDHPSATFQIRLQTVRTLVQEATAALTALGVDGPAIARAANSYEKHKRAGAKKGLQSLGKGYHFERLQFSAMKKAGDGGKDAKFLPKGGSRVAEALKGAKGLRANYQAQTADGLVVQDTLALAINDQSMIKLLLSKDIEQLKEQEFFAIFDAADALGGQNTEEVNFLRKTERIGKFLTWCENGLFHKQVGIPYTTAAHDIYAMDKYGNLITMDPSVFYNPRTRGYAANGTVQHNHSSLNAGGDVISAGEIAIQNGYITHIDNRSGHYKPTAKQLQSCVFSLRMADDADLSRLHIEAYHKDREYKYNDVDAFLAARF